MIFINNRLIPDSQAKVSVFDHGYLYGDGIYETLRVYKGVVFTIDEHIDRLFRSASMIHLAVPYSHEKIRRAVYRTVRANRQRDAYVRISVSRGPGAIGLDPGLCPKPTFVIISKTLKGYPEQYYRKGVKIAFVRTRRNFRGALNPQIKSLNFLNNILATIELTDADAHEAVMLNYRGYVAEGTTSNIFFVKNRVLCTPGIDVGILDGITRKMILDTAKEQNIKTKEGNFTIQDVYNANEVFISSTTRELMPVNMVDDRRIVSRIGSITKALLSAYHEKVREYLEKESKK
jgi:branched-chain amino acid aminotransferase